jgi:predicted dehydrogenase
MSQDPVRIAVVGAGTFGRNHLRVLKESPAAALVGVYDIDPGRRAQAAAEFGCPECTSLEAVAAAAEAAVVAAPTTAHSDVALRLMEAGLDVLVEKPLAAGVAEGRRMVEAAAALGRVLQVGHLERFNPAVEALEKIVTLPLFFEIHRLSVFSPRSLDVDVISDLMIHDLEILLALTRMEPSEIHAAGIRVLSHNVDIANVRLAFPNGCIANLTASRVSTERVRKLRLFQPRQYVSVDYSRQDLLAIGVDEQRQVRILPQAVEKGEPLKKQDGHFLACVRSRATPRVDGRQGLAALETAAAIQARIEEHAGVVARTMEEWSARRAGG